MSTLADITARRIAAEDLHGRVFAAAGTVINATPGGPELVKCWLKTWREMETLRLQEMELLVHGRITTTEATLPANLTQTASDAPEPVSATLTPPTP